MPSFPPSPKKSRAVLCTTRAATGERGAATAVMRERGGGNLVLQSCCLGKQRGCRLAVEHLKLPSGVHTVCLSVSRVLVADPLGYAASRECDARKAYTRFILQYIHSLIATQTPHLHEHVKCASLGGHTARTPHEKSHYHTFDFARELNLILTEFCCVCVTA